MVIILHGKGDTKDSKNYNPISLLSPLVQTVQTDIAKRMEKGS